MNKKLINLIASLSVIMFIPACGNTSMKTHSNTGSSYKTQSIRYIKNPNGNKQLDINISQNNKPLSNLSLDKSKMSTTKIGWGLVPRTDGIAPQITGAAQDMFKKYYTYYVGDTSKKIIYLTFDEGYEYGFTPKILDILKANNVTAAFFVTKPYIDSNNELVKRMVAEGHIVGNHTKSHHSMPTITDQQKFNDELLLTQKAFEDLTETKMPRFFRPPMGEYSELSLYYTEEIGYKTVLWSFAYSDWNVDKQPDKENAKKLILARTHDGGIYLLHAQSKTNTEILDSLIKEWKSKGFEFKNLTDIK